MKVLVVHNDYQQPGGERVAVQSQIALLRRHGHEVTTYLRNSSDIPNMTAWQKALLAPRTLYNRGTRREIASLVARVRPDVAHVHNVFPLISPAAYVALRDSGVPTVQTIHNFRLLCPNGLFYTRGRICERCSSGNTLPAVLSRCFRDSYAQSMVYASAIAWHRERGTFDGISHFLALTPFAADKLIRSGLVRPRQVRLLGNFLPDPLPLPTPGDARGDYALYIGRLSREKGIGCLIEAVSGISGQRLVIAGDGPQGPHFRQMAGQYAHNSVEFVGTVAGASKWTLLANAAAVVVPSECYEQFPITILEAMAAGAPVVASDLGGIPHVVEDSQTGLLFRAGDTNDLVSKLTWLRANPDLARAMGQHGRAVLEGRFSAHAHYAGLMRVYEEAAR